MSIELANQEAKEQGFESAWLVIESAPSILVQGTQLLSRGAELIALLHEVDDVSPRPRLESAWTEFTALMERRSKRIEQLVSRQAEDVALREEIEVAQAEEISLFADDARQSGLDEKGLIGAQTSRMLGLMDRRINQARTNTNRWIRLEEDARLLTTEFGWLASEALRIANRSELQARIETTSERADLATLSGRLAVMASRLEEQVQSYSYSALRIP